MAERPTRDLRVATLDTCDDVWRALIDRLTGITADEYLWEPVDGCWSVRAGEDGVARIDGFGQPNVEPAPITTIAWRLDHIAVDCLDSYSANAFGTTGASVTGDVWHLDPAAAIADCEAAWAVFRSGAAERSEAEWWAELGDTWGPFARHSFFDLVLHALHEVAHHGAEVALLRDLYRTRA